MCIRDSSGTEWTTIAIEDHDCPLPQLSGYNSYGLPLGRPGEGVGLLPAAGDEFMIRRGSDGDIVTLELDQWCAGPDWLNVDTSVGAPCGGNGHPRFGTGQLDFPGGGVQGSYSFMGCSHAGSCAATGADGVGFTTSQDHADGPSGCFGGCWTGSEATSYWNGVGLSLIHI